MIRTLLLFVFVTTAHAVFVTTAHAQEASPPVASVESFMEAYNAHDVEAMLELVHPDVQWLSVDGDTIVVQTAGEEQLGAAMRSYFEAVPSTRSEAARMMEAGNLVSVWERATWEAKSGTQSQHALAVYAVEKGLIRRVWYYPTQK